MNSSDMSGGEPESETLSLHVPRGRHWPMLYPLIVRQMEQEARDPELRGRLFVACPVPGCKGGESDEERALPIPP